MMKTKLTLFVTVLAAALFMGGCASTEPAFVREGLVAYYPFNGNAKDESGNGNDGEVHGATLSKDRHNTDGKAYSFNGRNRYIALPSFKYGEKLTVSLWANQIQNNHNGSIMVSKKPSREVESFQFFAKGDGTIYARVFSARGVCVGRSAPALNFDHWSHLVAIYDGGNTPSSLKIFRDGVRVDQSDDVYSETSSFKKFNDLNVVSEIGSQASGLSNFYGKLDDVRFYSRALSAEEITALYDLEKPKSK